VVFTLDLAVKRQSDPPVQSHHAFILAGKPDNNLHIAHRYRNQFMTEGLSNELEYCQQAVKPLLAALQRVTAALPAVAAGGNGAALRTLLSSARLACRVFYSLNSPGLTEVSRKMHGACDDGGRSRRSRASPHRVLRRRAFSLLTMMCRWTL